MPRAGLKLNADLGDIAQQVNDNFTRLENMFDIILDTIVGTAICNGSINIQTGLSTVQGATACLATIPTAAACFVQCAVGSSGIITVSVYTNTFALSSTAVPINWSASGELVLS